MSRIDGQQATALANLQALDKRYPGNVGVRMQLARLQFQNDKPAQAADELKTGQHSGRARSGGRTLAEPHTGAAGHGGKRGAAAPVSRRLYQRRRAQQRRAGLERRQKLLADPLSSSVHARWRWWTTAAARMRLRHCRRR